MFNHIEYGLKHFYTEIVFLGLYSIISAVHNWLFTGQSRITRVNWLNQEFSFSTSRTNQICEKILKVQFTPPLELGLNLILHLEFKIGMHLRFMVLLLLRSYMISVQSHSLSSWKPSSIIFYINPSLHHFPLSKTPKNSP